MYLLFIVEELNKIETIQFHAGLKVTTSLSTTRRLATSLLRILKSCSDVASMKR